MTPLTIDESRREVFVGKKRVHLSPKEYDLLVTIRSNSRIWSRPQLMEVMGCDDGDSRSVDQHVARLRRKLGRAYIETVPGYGYKTAFFCKPEHALKTQRG